MPSRMRTGIRIILAIGYAVLGTWLFEGLLTTLIYSSWFSDSLSTDTPHLTDLRQLYVFAYLAVFALAWALHWPLSVKRRVVASTVVLTGAILPLTAVLVRWYLRAHWPLSDIFDATERLALVTLLTAHGVTLALVNGLFYFTNLKHPVRSDVLYSATKANGRTTGTVHFGKQGQS